MSDYISREATISALFNGEHNIYSWDEIEETLSAVPAADVVGRELYHRALSDVVRLTVEGVKRKHGKWLDVTTLGNEFICWVCSECRHGADFVDEPYNFCPNCGARMDGDS